MEQGQLIVIWQPHLQNLAITEKSAALTIPRQEFMEWLQLIRLNGPHFMSRFPEFPVALVHFVSTDIPSILRTYGGHQTIISFLDFLRPYEHGLTEFLVHPEVQHHLPHIIELEMNSRNLASKMSVSHLANVVDFLPERDWPNTVEKSLKEFQLEHGDALSASKILDFIFDVKLAHFQNEKKPLIKRLRHQVYEQIHKPIADQGRLIAYLSTKPEILNDKSLPLQALLKHILDANTLQTPALFELSNERTHWIPLKSITDLILGLPYHLVGPSMLTKVKSGPSFPMLPLVIESWVTQNGKTLGLNFILQSLEKDEQVALLETVRKTHFSNRDIQTRFVDLLLETKAVIEAFPFRAYTSLKRLLHFEFAYTSRYLTGIPEDIRSLEMHNMSPFSATFLNLALHTLNVKTSLPGYTMDIKAQFVKQCLLENGFTLRKIGLDRVGVPKHDPIELRHSSVLPIENRAISRSPSTAGLSSTSPFNPYSLQRQESWSSLGSTSIWDPLSPKTVGLHPSRFGGFGFHPHF
jgi:hypothetical protein